MILPQIIVKMFATNHLIILWQVFNKCLDQALATKGINTHAKLEREGAHLLTKYKVTHKKW